MVLSAEAKAEHFPIRCYKLGPILYVPHYTIAGMYAFPGYQNGLRIRTGELIPERELREAGATPVEQSLWRRSHRSGMK